MLGHGAALFTTAPGEATGAFLAAYAAELDAWDLRGVLVISAHYQRSPHGLTGSGALATIHDHPARHLYSYQYPGHSTTALTSAIQRALSAGGVACVVDPQRGLDHGAWVPLSLLRPAGDLLVAQLSLDTNESTSTHIALGRALAPLRDQGILLLGSGGVTHNQDVFRRGYFGKGPLTEPEPFSREFDAWVSDTVTGQRGDERERTLQRFQEHPHARMAHPTIEHFLPMLVLAGAAGHDPATKVFEGFQHSLSTSVFRFG